MELSKKEIEQVEQFEQSKEWKRIIKLLWIEFDYNIWFYIDWDCWFYSVR
jgi:hypothetical protein